MSTRLLFIRYLGLLLIAMLLAASALAQYSLVPVVNSIVLAVD